jgi:hypothetical protein
MFEMSLRMEAESHNTKSMPQMQSKTRYDKTRRAVMKPNPFDFAIISVAVFVAWLGGMIFEQHPIFGSVTLLFSASYLAATYAHKPEVLL